jgi:hypothetical protein
MQEAEVRSGCLMPQQKARQEGRAVLDYYEVLPSNDDRLIR